MNGDLLPAVIAATGGGGLVAGLYAIEYRERAAMRESFKRYALRFPLQASVEGAVAALRGLSGLRHPTELVFETSATASGTKFYMSAPLTSVEAATIVLTSALPGLRTSDAGEPWGGRGSTLAVTIPTPAVLADEDATGSALALLGGLARMRDQEYVSVRWAISPDRAPVWQPSDKPSAADRQLAREWRTKVAGPGFRVVGQVVAFSPESGRAAELLQQVATVVRSRQRLGRGARIRSGGLRPASRLPRVTARSGWLSAAEMLGLLGWPLGEEVAPGVEVGASRELWVPRGMPRTGRRLFVGRDAHGERPVALNFEAARHHLLVSGPTGSGKSTLLGSAVLDDIAAGCGGFLVDPGGGLIDAITDRLRPQDVDRVVVLDPLASDAVVGLDIFGAGGDVNLAADAIVSAFAATFGDAWGVRSDEYMRLAVRTLAGTPGASLLDIPDLLFNDAARRRALEHVHDRFLLGQWAAWESLSVADRAQRLQAPLGRLGQLLTRPALRSVLAQPAPKLNLSAHFDARRWLMLSVAPGDTGEAAARLLGSLAMYAVWSALEQRVRVPEAERVPFAMYVDELASLSAVPFSFELLAERLRKFQAALTVAVQSLDRVDERLRNSLLANCASLLTFRASAADAARLARELPGISPQDIASLDAFGVAARIGIGTGSAVTSATGYTRPLPPATGTADAVRRLSAERYGTPRTELEALWRGNAEPAPEAPIGRVRRRP